MDGENYGTLSHYMTTGVSGQPSVVEEILRTQVTRARRKVGCRLILTTNTAILILPLPYKLSCLQPTLMAFLTRRVGRGQG